MTLVDMCSYYEIISTEIETSPIKIDKSETLIEKAYNIYGDVNSFWLFLFANNTINPFTLPKASKGTLLDEFSGTKTIYARSGSSELYSPEGSILTPFANTGGCAWQFSYVGNFSLTGGFAVSKAYNSFSKRTYLSEPIGLTLSVNDPVISIVSGTTYYQKLSNSGPYYTETIDFQSAITKEIPYSKTSNKETYLLLDSELPLFSKGSPPPYEPTGITQEEISFTDFVEDQSIYINAYVPYSVGYKAFSLIKQKYVV